MSTGTLTRPGSWPAGRAMGRRTPEKHWPQALTGLEELAGTFESTYDVACTVEVDRTMSIPSNTHATHIYRIAQEAARNAVQRGKASTIVVRLSKKQDMLTLEIADDGIGLDRPIGDLTEEGMGVRLMRYRCHLMNGSFSAETVDGGGTRLACTVPLD